MHFTFLLMIISAIFFCRQPADKQMDYLNTGNKIKVVLKPMEYTDTVMLNKLCHTIDTFYHAETSVIAGSSLPPFAYYKARNRYRADKLLDYLSGCITGNSAYIVGLTGKDISTTKDNYYDWGVFGLGLMPGKCCVVSTFRLKSHLKSQRQFEERLIRIVLHELGHNFGLDHCPSRGCLMEDAGGTIKTVNNEQTGLCHMCRKKIKKLLP